MRNKRLFNVFSLDLDAFAQSLGLAVTPRVPFLEKFLWRQKQLQQQKEQGDNAKSINPLLSKLTKQQSFGGGDEDEENSDDEDFIKVKRKDHDVEGEPVKLDEEDDTENEAEAPLVVPKREKLVTKASLAKKALKKNLQVNSKLKFDDEGETMADDRSQMKALSARQRTVNQDDDDGGINLVLSKALLTEEDQYDKQRFRELVKKRHKLQREKLRKKAEEAKGSDDEEEQQDDDNADDAGSESDHSVDLSWLPDPDKVYKNKPNASDRNESKSESSDASDDEKADDSDGDDDDVSDDEPAYKKSKLTNKMTLMDTEAIAASLLGS